MGLSILPSLPLSMGKFCFYFLEKFNREKILIFCGRAGKVVIDKRYRNFKIEKLFSILGSFFNFLPNRKLIIVQSFEVIQNNSFLTVFQLFSAFKQYSIIFFYKNCRKKYVVDFEVFLFPQYPPSYFQNKRNSLNFFFFQTVIVYAI